MKKFGLVLLAGSIAAAGYAVYNYMYNEKCNKTVNTLAGNVRNTAKEYANDIEDCFKSCADNCEKTFKGLKYDCEDMVDKCKDDVKKIRQLYDMEDAKADDIKANTSDKAKAGDTLDIKEKAESVDGELKKAVKEAYTKMMDIVDKINKAEGIESATKSENSDKKKQLTAEDLARIETLLEDDDAFNDADADNCDLGETEVNIDMQDPIDFGDLGI